MNKEERNKRKATKVALICEITNTRVPFRTNILRIDGIFLFRKLIHFMKQLLCSILPLFDVLFFTLN